MSKLSKLSFKIRENILLVLLRAAADQPVLVDKPGIRTVTRSKKLLMPKVAKFLEPGNLWSRQIPQGGEQGRLEQRGPLADVVDLARGRLLIVQLQFAVLPTRNREMSGPGFRQDLGHYFRRPDVCRLV